MTRPGRQTRAAWSASLKTVRALSRVAFTTALALQLVAPVRRAGAAGTVGTGSAGSCTETALSAALAGGGMVTFNCGAAPVTIMLSAQQPIAQDTAIDGAGKITLDGGGGTRLFQVAGSTILNLSNLTLTGGSASSGGAISNDGIVSITNSTLSSNHAPGGVGGAVSNQGMLTITGSTLADNAALAGIGGAIDNASAAFVTISSTVLSGNSAGLTGGAISSNGTLTVTGCTFHMNQSGAGGAVTSSLGTATISASTFSNNMATSGTGGGIYNNGTLTVMGSTFVGNTAAALGGGGIHVAVGTADISGSTFSGNSVGVGQAGGAVLNEGSLSMTAVTLSGNMAAGGMGGGISNFMAGTLTITNSTVSGNVGALGGGIDSAGTATVRSSTFFGNTGGGILNPGLHPVTLQDTIVASSPPNCSGVVTSLGNNLEGTDTCSFTAAGDLRNTDPQLGALADNGGPTMTHALPPTSPAVDAGGGCPATDQRGMLRPADGNGDGTAVCDIGAYEYTPPPVSTTSTTVPCAVASTFASIACRLASLTGTAGSEVPAGGLHDALAAALGKASSFVVQAETAAGQGQTRGPKRKLSKAVGALRKFEAKLHSRRAKTLPSALREVLRTASGDLRHSLAALRASL
jgi:predicted outer membrane repeat protein